MKLNCLILLSILNIINTSDIKLKEFVGDTTYTAITVLLSEKSSITPTQTIKVPVDVIIQEPNPKESLPYVEYEELYKIVMNKFCENSIDNESLCNGNKAKDKAIFLNNDFMTKLQNLIAGIEEEFKKNFNEEFEYKFKSFITKWLLIKVQEYSVSDIIESNKEKFKALFLNVKNVEISYKNYINSRHGMLNYSNVHQDSFFDPFIQLECLRKWNQDLESNLESLLDDFYSNGKSCSDIADKYFSPKGKGKSSEQTKSFGFLTNDPLLSSLWMNVDLNSWKKCMKNSEYNIPKENKEIASPRDKDEFKSKIKSIFDFNPSYFQDEFDMELFIKNNRHKIRFYFPGGFNMERKFANGIESLEKFNKLNWENFVNIFAITNFVGYSNQLLKHFELIYLAETMENEFYEKFLTQIQEYEKKLKDKKEYPRMMIRNSDDFDSILHLLDIIKKLDQQTMEILLGFEPDNKWSTKKFEKFRTEMGKKTSEYHLYQKIKDYKFEE